MRHGKLPKPRPILLGLEDGNIPKRHPRAGGALGLSQDWGVIVSDVYPEGPPEKAGLEIGDVVLGIDGQQVDSLPISTLALHLINHGTSAKLLRSASITRRFTRPNCRICS